MAQSASTRTPKYRRQKGKHGDRAFVELGGARCYLGAYGTPESRVAYGRAIAEWVANDGTLPVSLGEITIVEVAARFMAHAVLYYRKLDGTATNEQTHYRCALRPLCDLYGHTKAADFGPRALKALRTWWVDRGVARVYANKQTGRVRHVFKWAASEEIVPTNVWHALPTVVGLKRGRTDASETEAVKPVPDATVDATLPYMTSALRTMVEVQRRTGCRPGEVCMIRACDLDTTGTVWTYTPSSHKTEYHERIRTVFIGPRTQAALRPFLRRDLAAFLFSPIESEAERQAAMHAARKTPMSCGNTPGSHRKRQPKRRPRERYDTHSYGRAIRRACDRAFPAPEGTKAEALKEWRREHRWAPNRLRHTYGTEVRREHGLEAAQVLLGHAMANVIQGYAERDVAKAVRVAAKIG